MTKREAIESPFNFEIPSKLIDKVIIDRSIKEGAEYTKTNEQEIDVAIADICGRLINMKSFSEGELSITFDLSALRTMRTDLLSKWNLTEDEMSATISSRKVW